jgi:hypothetical protein
MTKKPSLPFICRICGKEFTSRKERGEHTKSEHPEYYHERNRLSAILMVPFALVFVLTFLPSSDLILANTLNILLVIDVVVASYIIYRIFVYLPKKYKPHTLSLQQT